jgi:hypothetical protein
MILIPRTPVRLAILCWLAAVLCAPAGEFRPIGDFILRSRTKITGDHVTRITIKPMLIHVSTDGIQVRVFAEDETEAHSTYDIYRSDGIGRQNGRSGVLEVIPGVQATSSQGGGFRHLRLTREALTITQFPGISDQTIITQALAVTPTTESRPANPPPPAKDQEPARQP